MITKDGRDVAIEKITPENYLVPKGEEGHYHAVIEVVQYDQKTGRKVSHPRIQKFSKKIFETHVWDSLKKQGYTITILHDPNAWLKEQQEIAAEREKQAKEARAKAEKERFDTAVAKAVESKIDAAVKAAVAKALGDAGKSEGKAGRPAKEGK